MTSRNTSRPRPVGNTTGRAWAPNYPSRFDSIRNDSSSPSYPGRFDGPRSDTSELSVIQMEDTVSVGSAQSVLSNATNTVCQEYPIRQDSVPPSYDEATK